MGCKKQPDIESFVYQLQHAKLKELASHNFDLAIIDWEFCECDQNIFNTLQNQNKKIVTYLSIGEAEDYRDYWNKEWDQNPPPFLEEENPDWKGNFKVKYWDSGWQNIILKKVEAIASNGYDGVYLDIIDAYYYFQEKGRKSARAEMIDFVIRISQKAKAIKPTFLVIPQNSPELTEDKSYLKAIDGIGIESTWFVGNTRRKQEELKWILPHMKKVEKSGRFVLTTEYTSKPDLQKEFVEKARAHNFVPYIGNRALDTVGIIYQKK